MEVICIILPLALVMAGAAVMAFLCAAKRSQFDDLDTPQFRVVFDDERPTIPGKRRKNPVKVDARKNEWRQASPIHRNGFAPSD